MTDSERSYVSRFFSSQFSRLPYPTQDFTDAVVLVTGGNTGLGLEAARHFVRLQAATVILAVRDMQKGQKAKDSIEATTKIQGVVQVWPLDLESVQSVQDFTTKAAGLPRLDVVVANAGISTSEWTLIGGTERSILVNVISTFLLIVSLLPKLQETATQQHTRPRVVVVSSEGHETTEFVEQKADRIFDALKDKTQSNMDERYDTTKLIQLYLVRAVAEHLSLSNKPAVTINAVSPGLCKTGLLRETPLAARILISPIKAVLARSAEEGSRTLVHAAGPDNGETHGKYLRDCKMTEPAAAVRSEQGQATQEKLFKELLEELEEVCPGIRGNL
ncbi:putative short-chain dehydrogenase/reductase family protein [Aspergillus saccharolyticus JOP 1030-1]|uniref:NAD(P)-binding protein n=1 Tax=Aspergillus saccharolyticus JOP 1030-1 TaxID=1450539 RepID=A0A318ZQ05_9EURO|nr:NAD(P)-binding protein [Aspergillus saccharolyticus JOP 1030-1]PYH46503.1 NAD(P)-binding protein [Aspergillus saccharolyticus JOP 1030-1]